MADLLTSFGIDWRLLIMQIVNFGVLLAVLTYFLYRPILNVLDERRKKIEQGVKDASDAKHKLENAENEVKEILGTASKNADEIIVKARDMAVEKGDDIIKKAESRGEKIELDAHAKAKEVAKRVLDGSNKEIARAAILAAERLVNKKLN
jgi:F-type H+-transporting ATPase subunit b